MGKPKILICTVEAWNSRIGANTFSELFKFYSRDKIANLYIREEIPDSNVCSRYFQISEIRTIKSIFNKRIKPGREVGVSKQHEVDSEIEVRDKIYNNKKRSYFKLCIRELLWKFGKWKTKELDDFLDSFKPDIVLYSMEGYIHFNSICRYILRKTKGKGIGYFWDDNFTYKQARKSLGYYFLRFFQRRSLQKLASKTSSFFAITEKTKIEADSFFKIDCRVLTKPIDKYQDPVEATPQFPYRMLYTGNLKIGRFDVIKKIANVLNVINVGEQKMILDIYSSTQLNDNDLSKLGKYVNFCGCISQQKALELQKKADILLFLESFKKGYSKIARLSFSTKITDYLAAGKCILAIGKKDIAPMEYFRNNDAAICIFNEKEILSTFMRLIDNPSLIEEYSKKASQCGVANHNRAKIQSILYKELGIDEDNSN